jgi:hypothetical protein
MFGLVKIAEGELKVKEWRLYKAYYCSLCRQIANYSQFSRLLLSYDMVFLGLLLGTQLQDENERCKSKFLRRCRKRCGDERMDYTAAASIILQYQKLKNDFIDGEKKKKYAMYAIDAGYRKAARTYPSMSHSISESMRQLYALEDCKCSDYPALQDCFADMMSSIVISAPISDDTLDIKAKIVYHVAAWVYLFDMLIDIEADKKSGDFNAILLNGAVDAQNDVLDILTGHIHDAEQLSRLLPYSEEVAIIQNIISYGMPMQMTKNKAL